MVDRDCGDFPSQAAAQNFFLNAGGGEEREAVVGMTQGWQLLVVVYTFREDCIRLISARPVTSQERRAYEDGPAP